MKGTNGAQMKAHNVRLILRLIRRGQCARTDIAAATGLTKASVTGLTDELMREGLIAEIACDKAGGVGRRPTYLALKEDARLVIAFSMTRAGYEAGVYNLGGHALTSRRCAYDATPEQTVIRMADMVTAFCRTYGDDRFLGIGVCCPGPVDYRAGRIINPPNFAMWHNVPLQDWLQARCSLPVQVENIANALALYEGFFGSCSTEGHYAYVVVDEGIGSGIIIDGQIYRGAMGYGNELGHTVIELDGRPCACGNRGCLERYASMPALLENTGYTGWKQAVAADDKTLMERERRYLAAGLLNLVNLFDLNAVVIGGEVAAEGDWLAERLQADLQERAIVRHPVRIALSDSEAVRGAAAAAIILHHRFF